MASFLPPAVADMTQISAADGAGAAGPEHRSHTATTAEQISAADGSREVLF